MKHSWIALAVAAASMAVAAHFSLTTAAVGATGLNVAWQEVGLAANAKMKYTVSGKAVATYGCFNRGNQNPAAQNKRAVVAAKLVTEIIRATNAQGNVSAAATLKIPANTTLTCPKGQDALLSSVTYSQVTIHNQITKSSFMFSKNYSRTFRELKK